VFAVGTGCHAAAADAVVDELLLAHGDAQPPRRAVEFGNHCGKLFEPRRLNVQDQRVPVASHALVRRQQRLQHGREFGRGALLQGDGADLRTRLRR
jgi:hypothetical protein